MKDSTRMKLITVLQVVTFVIQIITLVILTLSK